MIPALLDTPARRETIAPELIGFFRETGGPGWVGQLDLFLRMFAGTSFTVPGPEFMRQLMRDETVIRALEEDDTVENQLAILRVHGITYQHLTEIWRAVKGRELPGPAARGEEAVQEAGRLIRGLPSCVNDIVGIYRLNAAERAAAIAASGRAVVGLVDESGMTKNQSQLLRRLRGMAVAGRVKLADVERSNPRPRRQSLEALEEKGRIRREGGELVLLEATA